MPCRVGITRNPEERKKYWESKVVGLTDWNQEYFGSKSAAQNEEDRRHEDCSTNQSHRGTCHAYHGGGDPDAYGWYVYEFDYSRNR